MKLVIVFGSSAVGKMTVGQELAKITDLKLFHNHMAIEPVLEIFGEFNLDAILDIRDVIFRNFIYTDNYGMIFTFMFNFDNPFNWEYLECIEEIFGEVNSEIYYVELVASQEIRLERNKTENRLKYKPSKRNIEESNKRLIRNDQEARFESYEGEFDRKNYIKINNENLSAEKVAKMIKESFLL